MVEIDGGIHEEQKDYDKLRDQIINQYGIKIIRFTNEEVVNRCDWVLSKIKEYTKHDGLLAPVSSQTKMPNCWS